MGFAANPIQQVKLLTTTTKSKSTENERDLHIYVSESVYGYKVIDALEIDGSPNIFQRTTATQPHSTHACLYIEGTPSNTAKRELAL